MRLIAEERQVGTWDLLLTKPLPLWKIICGKYFAAWTLVVLAQLPCLIHYAMVYQLAEPVGNIDSGAFFGSFIGLFFLSAAFCAVGLWASSLSKSQIVAFILGLVVCFMLFYGFDLLASLFTGGHIVNAIQWIGLSEHYRSISRGVIDLRDMLYFCSISALFVIITIRRFK